MSSRFGLAVVVSVLGALALAAAAQAATDVTYSPSEFGSSFNVDGENDADAVGISVAGNTITITDTGAGGIITADPDCAVVNATTVTCPLDPPGADRPVDFFAVQVDDGADSIVVENLDAEGNLSGDAGNKAFTGGPGDESMDSEGGNDTLNGGPGDDFLDANNDVFEGTGGTDTMIGGPGQDRASFSSREVGVNITLDGVANDGIAGEDDQLLEIEEVSGGQGDDTITGNAGPNELSGSRGNDLITGLDGSDYVAGDDGDDTVAPGDGHDEVWCGDGLDVLLSTPGDLVYSSCERTGATVESESAKVSKKNIAKVKLACPIDEGVACEGELVLVSNGKTLSKQGAYSVEAGGTKSAKAKLTKKGAKKLARAGGLLLVSAEARTDEPGGVALAVGRLQIIG